MKLFSACDAYKLFSVLGLLAFRPDSFPFETEPISEDRYLVTLPDLLDIENVQTRLIVLSSGQKCGSVIEMTPELNLPQMFLSVGKHTVGFNANVNAGLVVERLHSQFLLGPALMCPQRSHLTAVLQFGCRLMVEMHCALGAGYPEAGLNANGPSVIALFWVDNCQLTDDCNGL